MLPHQDIAFAELIDRVVRYGAATCSWDDLYAWFNTDEIDQPVWREIYARYKTLAGHYGWEELPELHVLRFDAYLTLFRDGADDEGQATLQESGELEETEAEDEAEDEL